MRERIKYWEQKQGQGSTLLLNERNKMVGSTSIRNACDAQKQGFYFDPEKGGETDVAIRNIIPFSHEIQLNYNNYRR